MPWQRHRRSSLCAWCGRQGLSDLTLGTGPAAAWQPGGPHGGRFAPQEKQASGEGEEKEREGDSSFLGRL